MHFRAVHQDIADVYVYYIYLKEDQLHMEVRRMCPNNGGLCANGKSSLMYNVFAVYESSLCTDDLAVFNAQLTHI